MDAFNLNGIHPIIGSYNEKFWTILDVVLAILHSREDV